MQNICPWDGTPVGEEHRGLSPVGGTPGRRRGKTLFPEQLQEQLCDEVTVIPMCRLPALLGGVEIELGKGRGGKVYFKVYFTPHYPAVIS